MCAYQSSGQICDGHNTGTITGTTYVGGIVGYVSNSDLIYNYNKGNVIATTNVGGIAGYSGTVWGKGTAEECVYMKTETINTTLNGFGNSNDIDGIVYARDTSFFCINSDMILHIYSSDCDTACDNCGYERTVTHTYDNIKYDAEKHWYECDCGEKKADSEASHIGGTATCTNKAKCDICQETYGAFAEHDFDDTSWGYKAADGHAHTCQISGCSEHDTVIAHTSSGAATEDVAETCTECGYIIAPALGYNEHTNGDIVNSNGGGLSGGVIAGIVIGSVAVAGIGGFSIIWFVIKKKSWADFLAIFKK